MKKLMTFVTLILALNSNAEIVKGKNWIVRKHKTQNELISNLISNQDCFLETIDADNGKTLFKARLEADEFDKNNEYIAKISKAVDRTIKLKLEKNKKTSEYTIDLHFENDWDRHDTSRAISSDLQAFKVGVESRNFSGTGFYSGLAHTYFFCK